jgi:hypothetical protein
MTSPFENMPYRTEYFQACRQILKLPSSELISMRGFGSPYIELVVVGNFDIEP